MKRNGNTSILSILGVATLSIITVSLISLQMEHQTKQVLGKLKDSQSHRDVINQVTKRAKQFQYLIQKGDPDAVSADAKWGCRTTGPCTAPCATAQPPQEITTLDGKKYEMSCREAVQSINRSNNVVYVFEGKELVNGKETGKANVLIESCGDGVSVGDWNYYVKREGGPEVYNYATTVCNPAEVTKYSDCVHTGEHRKFDLGIRSCSGLSIEDSKQVFDWECAQVGSNAIGYSKGFKKNKGLTDLINWTGANSGNSWDTSLEFIAKDGSTEIKKASISYKNQVMKLPPLTVGTNEIKLSCANTVYTVPESISISGLILLNTSQLSLVTKKDTKIQFKNMGDNCNLAQNLKLNTSPPNAKCLVGVGDIRHIWIEGNFDAQNVSSPASTSNNASTTITFSDTKLSRIHNTLVKNTIADSDVLNDAGIGLLNASMNYISDIESVRNNQGLYIGGDSPGSHHNIFSNISVAANNTTGILLTNKVKNNIFSHLRISNGDGNYGILSLNSNNVIGNSFQNLIITGSLGRGLYVNNSGFNIFTQMLSVNNRMPGLQTGGTAENNIYHNIVIAGSAKASNEGGVYLSGSKSSTFSQLVSANNQSKEANAGSGIYFGTGNTNNKFSGNLLVGTNHGALNNFPNNELSHNCIHGGEFANATVSGCSTLIPACRYNTAGPTLAETNSVGLDSKSCNNQYPHLSNSHLLDNLIVNLRYSFSGLVTADTENAHHGTTPQSKNITDWHHFENNYRIWNFSRLASPASVASFFPNELVSTECTGTNFCTVYDWSLKKLGPVSALNNIIFNNTDSGDSLKNDTLVPSPPGPFCFPAVDGDKILVSTPFTWSSDYEFGYNGKRISLTPATATLQKNAFNKLETCQSGNTDCVQVYLKSAVEIVNDGIGDEDGLCEDNENCLYTPNFGAYQGHFRAGNEKLLECPQNPSTLVEKVVVRKMFYYEENGYP